MFPSTDRVYATRRAKLAAVGAACTEPALVIGPFEDELDALARELAVSRAVARVDSRPAFQAHLDETAAGSAPLALVPGELIVSEATVVSVRVNVPLTILVVERHPLRTRDDAVLVWAAGCPPGTSVTYFCSLQDGLFARFGGESVLGLVRRLDVPENEPLEHSLILRSIDNAQRKIAKRARGDLRARSCAEWLVLNVG